MGYEELQALSLTYPPQARGALFELAQKYRVRDEREVMEVAAMAADVSLDDVLNLGLEPKADPQIREALELQYRNIDVESLAGASAERLHGLANGIKGKYFEIRVRDKLNAGERVGELELQPGQTAHLAASSTQSGWDLRIENEDGSTDELLQVRATESMSYVKKALVEHPDIRVAVPSEVDHGADDILGTDISNEQLNDITQTQIDEMAEGELEDLIDKGAEAAFDSVPFASMVATGVMEGGNYLTGRATLRESILRAAKRTGRAGIYNALAVVLAPTGVGVPVVIGMRIAEGRVSKRTALVKHLEARTRELERLVDDAVPPNRQAVGMDAH